MIYFRKPLEGIDRPQMEADVVIVGGGPAGLSAAVALTRSRRRVLVVDSRDPRNAPAAQVHNYLGREGTPPGDLLTAGRAERWASDYVARVALHRDQIRDETNRLDWLFTTHTTSRSAAELLLFLHAGMMVSKSGTRVNVKAGRAS